MARMSDLFLNISQQAVTYQFAHNTQKANVKTVILFRTKEISRFGFHLLGDQVPKAIFSIVQE